MRATQFTHKPFFVKLSLALAGVLFVSLAALALHWHARMPRAWAARDVPIAFWAWRNETPAEWEVARAAREAGAQTLFLRAGQIHDEDGTLKRVRAIAGSFPRGIELHLVYNSTPTVLAEFERLDPVKLAGVIVDTYAQDRARAMRDGASVVGLQLDIDAPTRLLAHYARILRATRERLPAGTRLSVTGLPTWMESGSLKELLAAVDFWIPQCYGATIPQRLEQPVAISSPQAVARAVNRARTLEKPFYAGLSAYGYALLYDARGVLVSLRGDMDPSRIARDASLQLVARSPFEPSAQSDAALNEGSNSEWRYIYRAREDGVIDGLVVHAGDSLVLDVPSAASLRESARMVRELAGEKLLGLCIFRLPGSDDPATLPLEQVTAALLDTAPASGVEVEAKRAGQRQAGEKTSTNDVLLTATNSGNTSALFGEDALTIDLRVPAGSLRAVRLNGFSAIETLCESGGKRTGGEQDSLQPCAERRANVIRFRSSGWTTGTRAGALVSFIDAPPEHLTARVSMQRDDGRAWEQELQITIGGDER